MKKPNRIKSNGKSTAPVSQPEKAKPAKLERRPSIPAEYKVVALRECAPLPNGNLCDAPELAWEYWKTNVATDAAFRPEQECFVALLLNRQGKVKGHNVISIGTVDTILVHARETFRAAVVAASSWVVLMHNHPSGSAAPSDGDIAATNELIAAGRVMKIDVADHVIVGEGTYFSFREHGLIGADGTAAPAPATFASGSGAVERPPMSAEQAGGFLDKAQARFKSKIEFDLYCFAAGSLTDDAVLALLAEAVVKHEAALRREIVPGLPLRCLTGVAMFNVARAVSKRARGLGWCCLNDAEAGGAALRDCLDGNLPGLSGRGFLDVRGASFLMADFLYEHRQLIVEKILKPMNSIYEALELAEALAIAEKDSWRGGGLACQGEQEEPQNTALVELAQSLFVASQMPVEMDVENMAGALPEFNQANGKRMETGFEPQVAAA